MPWRAPLGEARGGTRGTAAKNWRQDAAVALREGTFSTVESITVREAADRWVAGASRGTITNRSGSSLQLTAITPTGTGFAVTGGTCSTVNSLPKAGTCTIIVT